MTLSNSDQNSNLPIKKSCELSIFQFFKKIHKETNTTCCRVKILLLGLYCRSQNNVSYYTFVR